MAFPTPGTKTAPATATATKAKAEGAGTIATLAPAFNPAAVTAAPKATATTKTAAAKTTKTDIEKLLNTLKLRLSQNEAIREAGNPIDLEMFKIARIAPELHQGITEVLEHFGFDFGENSNGLRFLPESVRKDGSTKPAALYFISLAAAADNSDGAVALRWGNETKEYGAEDDIYPTGIRILGKSAVLNTPTLTCPVGLLVKSELTEDEEKNLSLAGTFGELAEYLTQSGGGNILADLPEGFMMLLTEAEQRTSKKGNKYTLLHGTQLNSDSQPIGDVSIFSPGRGVDYWADKGSKTVLQYDSTTKVLNVLSASDGAVLDSLPLMPKTLKLKELEIGATYDWLGCELVQFKSSKGWVIKVRKQAGENGEPGGTIEQCYTNRAIENVISGGAAMILEAAGEGTDDLDAIFKLESDEPFGTILIRGHKPYSSGVSVDVECLINKSESEKKEEDALFAELGLI